MHKLHKIRKRVYNSDKCRVELWCFYIKSDKLEELIPPSLPIKPFYIKIPDLFRHSFCKVLELTHHWEYETPEPIGNASLPQEQEITINTSEGRRSFNLHRYKNRRGRWQYLSYE